jgi:hypothetical protein
MIISTIFALLALSGLIVSGLRISAALVFKSRQFVAIFPFLLMAVSAHGQAVSPDPQRQSLGSMNSSGEVYLNESRAPSELTVFPGDALRTGGTGMAILTNGGNNSLQIFRQTQILFTADPHYFAELKAGTISVKSVGGGGETVVRAGNFVVVPTNRNETTAATIESKPDGSFIITCTTGNIGVIPMQEAPGIFLQAGQSGQISPKGELATLEKPPPSTQVAGKSHRTLIYLGLAAGAAAGAAAGLAAGHGPVSPVAP